MTVWGACYTISSKAKFLEKLDYYTDSGTAKLIVKVGWREVEVEQSSDVLKLTAMKITEVTKC